MYETNLNFDFIHNWSYNEYQIANKKTNGIGYHIQIYKVPQGIGYPNKNQYIYNSIFNHLPMI